MQNTPPSPARLSVSIVLHNSPLDRLGRVLDCLERAGRAAVAKGLLDGVAVELVDNASGSDYRAALSREMEARPAGGAVAFECRFLAENRGFGAGHNAALASASSEFHLVLNPDAELAPDALIKGLSRLAADPGLALLSPMAVGASGQREFLCKRYPSVLVLLLRGFAPAWMCRVFDGRLAHYEMRDACGGDAAVHVEIASGCCMLARTGALRDVGGFDETFFLYFEDFDLSLRLADRGGLLFEPAMRIVHHGGYTAEKGWRHLGWFLRSALRFFNRHGWRWL